MIQKYLYLSLAILFFGLGIYAWKLTKSGVYAPRDAELIDYHALSDLDHILLVGKEGISQDEIEWEFELHTRGMFDKEELTPIPEIGRPELVLSALKDRLLADLIERKLLYQFIKMDPDFDLADSSLYSGCLEKWHATLEESPDFFASQESRARLKSRLCERSIIMQYLEQRIFANIAISTEEIASYYEENPTEFEEPAKVTIRQIVLASELEARRLRYRVTARNFKEMVRQHSVTPEAENGGILGPFAMGEMPRVFDVAFTMRKGEIRGILKSTYGFHIIKIEDRKPRSKLSLEEASPKIQAKLTEIRQEEEYQKWVEMALNEITVKSPRPL